MDHLDPAAYSLDLRHARLQEERVIAVGPFIPDHLLRPGESVRRTILVHVPEGEYDALEASAIVPTIAKPDGWNVKYELDDYKNLRLAFLYQGDDGGSACEQETPDPKRCKMRGPNGHFPKGLKMQYATWHGAYSLWWEKSVARGPTRFAVGAGR